MQEKEIMENLLLNLKCECDLMMHGAIESSTSNVHSTFTGSLSEMTAMQNQVYSIMAKKGWYPSKTAQQTEIDAVKQKYNQAG